MVARASTFPFDTVIRHSAGMGSMKIERSITNDRAPWYTSSPYETSSERQCSARSGRDTQSISYTYRGGLQKKASTIQALTVKRRRNPKIQVENAVT